MKLTHYEKQLRAQTRRLMLSVKTAQAETKRWRAMAMRYRELFVAASIVVGECSALRDSAAEIMAKRLVEMGPKLFEAPTHRAAR